MTARDVGLWGVLMLARNKADTPLVRPPGMGWKPGQSGNPRGRPKVVFDIDVLAREHGPEAIEVMAKLMRDTTATPGIRLAAATALLDRGFGRPKQTVDATVNINLAEEHLAALNALTDTAIQLSASGQDQTLMIDVTPDPFGPIQSNGSDAK